MERTTSALVFLLVLSASAGAQRLYAGDQCSSGGLSGACRRIDACPTALADVRNGKMPTICSYDKKTPIVCCVEAAVPTTPSTTTTTTTTTTAPQTVVDRDGAGSGQKARRMCRTYAAAVWQEETVPTLILDEFPMKKNRSHCGIPPSSQLIIGGESALPREFPHMAAIGFGDEQRISWLCGGSLISERFVLTAAHCVSAGNKGLARWVRLGDLNLANSNDDSRSQQLSVAEHFRHPLYSSFSHYDDIALLKLSLDAQLTPHVRPACLQVDRNIATEYFLASGWGRTDWADEVGSDNLMKVQLSSVTAPDCTKSYRSLMRTKKLKFGIQDDKMVCAGVKEGGKDTCRGDSGGPLQFVLQDPFCMYSVAGVTSFGSTVCGAKNSPAVYTRVSNYLPWIEGIVWP